MNGKRSKLLRKQANYLLQTGNDLPDNFYKKLKKTFSVSGKATNKI